MGLAIATLDQFYEDGGTLPIIYQGFGNINSWAVTAPTYFNIGTPKVQGSEAVEGSLPPPLSYGTPAPGSVTFSQDWERVGQVMDKTFLVSVAGTYNVGVIIGTGNPSTGTFEMVVDGNNAGSVNVAYPNSGAAFTVPVYLSVGQHSVNGVCTAVSGGYFLTGLAVNASIVAPLYFSTAPAATPAAVSGTTAQLSAAGQSTAGNSGIIYTWSATTVPPGATPPTFSVNGSNAASSTTATFHAAGTYIFTASMTDSAGDVASNVVTVVVAQTPTAVAVTPSPVNVAAGAEQSFSAALEDQFGAAVPYSAYTWALSGNGTLSAAGLYTAPASTWARPRSR